MISVPGSDPHPSHPCWWSAPVPSPKYKIFAPGPQAAPAAGTSRAPVSWAEPSILRYPGGSSQFPEAGCQPRPTDWPNSRELGACTVPGQTRPGPAESVPASPGCVSDPRPGRNHLSSTQSRERWYLSSVVRKAARGASTGRQLFFFLLMGPGLRPPRGRICPPGRD